MNTKTQLLSHTAVVSNGNCRLDSTVFSKRDLGTSVKRRFSIGGSRFTSFTFVICMLNASECLALLPYLPFVALLIPIKGNKVLLQDPGFLVRINAVIVGS